MTRSLAHELTPTASSSSRRHSRAACADHPFEHHQKRYVDSCALGRIGQPAECGELCAWMASARNTYLNGAVVVLDGGTLA
jgi:NAD(P)-dependent dehydrogenase (short-subunit alcohol dehydrogenase family)